MSRALSFTEVPSLSIPPRLASLVEDGVILEVLSQLKSGKEATVFTCRANPRRVDADLVAVKVFREHASFHRTSRYLDGREILDEREARAARTKTAFGRDVAYHAWRSREWDRLVRCHEAGVSVPRPIAHPDGALIMELIGDAMRPAPQLRDVRLTHSEAEEAWAWLIYDIELMLGANLVHGDLSPYNLLVWGGRVRVIDLPQAVDVRFHADPWPLLLRDLEHAAAPFERAGVATGVQQRFRELRRDWQTAKL